MKPARVIILILILGLITGSIAWKAQWFFLQNKVTFLLNQRRFIEATELIDNLEKRNPDHPRTDFLQVKAHTITGEFAKAVEAAQGLRQVPDPEMLYWLSLAQHQLGDSAAAEKTANEFLGTSEKLPAASPRIIRALAGTVPIVEPPNKDALEFRLLFPVEKAVYLGLAGLHQWQIGRLDTATQLLRDAFVLDNRNPRFLTEGAQALALVGDVNSAQMFWDYSENGSIKPLFDELQELYRSFQSISLTLNSDDLARGGRKIDVARAVAWAATSYAREGPGAGEKLSGLMDSLLEEYPYDPVLQVHKAALLENLGDTSSALEIYQRVQQKNPSYTVLVRTMNLESVTPEEFMTQSANFIQALHPVATLLPTDLRVENGTRNRHDITFRGSGITTGTIEVEESGSYMITTVARGSVAEGKWPLVQVQVDGEPTGVIYVCRQEWDCYSLPVMLEPGSHMLELMFDDPVEQTNSDRTFHLKSLYMTLTGVAYVR